MLRVAVPVLVLAACSGGSLPVEHRATSSGPPPASPPPAVAPSELATIDLAATERPPSGLPIDTCRPDHEDHEGEEREHVKHRIAGAPADPLRVTVTATIVEWGPPCDARSCHDDAPYPMEQDAFRIDGDAWRIKLDPGDCDLHVELSEPGAPREAGRMIVEIPDDPPFARVRLALDDLVRARTGHHLRGKLDLDAPIPLRVAGLRFWDGHHLCKNRDCPHPERAAAGEHCSHGTRFVCGTWELHPVLALGPR